MTNTLHTKEWNADPNSPDVEISILGNSVTLDFLVNYFIYDNFKEGDKARLTFENCLKYSFNSMNDEGYFMGQYRYKYNDLPWGEFYEIQSNWQTDFPIEQTLLSELNNIEKLRHYIFFFKDNTFECVAENYLLKFYSNNEPNFD